jgi:hypothetical protein
MRRIMLIGVVLAALGACVRAVRKPADGAPAASGGASGGAPAASTGAAPAGGAARAAP